MYKISIRGQMFVNMSTYPGRQCPLNVTFGDFSVIGKGGEQITRLQAETGCKIQIAPGKF